MKWLYLVLSTWLLAATNVSAAIDLISAIKKLPPCGVQCLTTSISASSCASVFDGDCVCSDKAFQDAATACVIKACSIKDALELARVQADTCQWPERNRHRDIALTLLIVVPALLCPWIRVYGRWITIRKLALDDYLVCIAGVAYLGVALISQIVGYQAFGVDVWTLDVETMTEGLKWFYIAEIFYQLCLGLTKVSVMCFYLRIFPQQNFRRITKAFIGFVVVSTVTFMALSIFQCRPISYTWTGWTAGDRDEKCLGIDTIAFAAAASSIFQDVFVLVLPIPLVLQLQTGWRSKAGITLMFSLGVFVLITTCVRLRYLVDFGHTHNPSWDFTDPAIWSSLEVAVSIVVVCLPAIRLLFDRFKPGWFRTNFTRGEATTIGNSSSGADSKSTGIRKGLSTLRSENRHPIYRSENRHEKLGSEIELSPRLGDKIHGDVQTQIYPGRDSEASHVDPSLYGIQVTTTTRIDDSWQVDLEGGKSNISQTSSELGQRPPPRR